MAAASNDLECLKDLDFWTFYSSLCMINKVCPLRSVIRHLKGTELCCPVEAIRSEHWKFILEALSVNNSLTKVHLRSDVKHPKDFIGPLILKQRKRKSEKGFPTPYGLQARNLSEICRSLSSCLKLSRALNVLKLEHLPLKLEDIELLSVGLRKSKLNEISFYGCHLNDDSVQVICDSLKTSLVEWLDFSSCALSIEGVKHISELIKSHADRRRSEAWPDTLRYRFAVLDNLKGLSRISLNDNAGIDDDACKVLADCLMDDLWIKALDLQKCHITDEGASSLLQVLTYNCVLEVLDLQWNFISDDILQRIIMQLDLNNSGKTLKYEKLPMKFEEIRKVKRMPRRKATLKIKITKKNPIRPRPVKTNISKRSPVKEAFTHLKCDKGTVTDNHYLQDQNIECENGHSNTHLTQKYLACLAHSKRQQQHLVKKLKVLSLENHFLRDALQKQAIPEGMILIDNDTYNSVKETFEKLENFLAEMKENGWVSLKDTDANAIRNFIFDDPKNRSLNKPEKLFKEAESAQEQSLESSSEHLGPSRSSSAQMSYVRTKEQSSTKPDHEVCTCESLKHREVCNISKQHFVPHDVKLVPSGGQCLYTEGEKLRSVNAKNLPIRPLDRTLVRKIFECMQRIHNTPSYSGNGKPSCSSELPKKFVVQTVRSKPTLDGHINRTAGKQKNRFESTECIHLHKQIPISHLRETSDSHQSLSSRNRKASIDDTQYGASNSLKSNSISDLPSDFHKARENLKKVRLYRNSESQEDSSLLHKKERKMKVDTASQSLPSMTFDNSLLSNQFKNLSLTKDSTDLSEQTLKSQSTKEDAPISNQSPSSNQISAAKPESTFSQTSKKSDPNISEILSDKSQTNSKSPKSIFTSMSSHENKPDSSNARSYLESVDSAESTDKDVKSLSEIGGSLVDSKKQKSLNESPIKDENVAAIMWLLNEGSSVSNSDMSDSEPEISKAKSGKVSEESPVEESIKSNQPPKPKTDLDDIGIPSLSDITTVTSRSINSIMYELSESDKV